MTPPILRKVCYTVNSGGYEQPHKPAVVTDDWDYYTITAPSKGVRFQRNAKILPPMWDSYDISVWHDGNIQVNCNLNDFIADNLSTDLSLMRHSGWDCVYREAEAIKATKKDKPEIIDAQVKRYLDDGYPLCNGMVATGVMIRKHTKPMKDFCKKWWKEVEKGSHRDQMSFNYVMSKKPLKYNMFPMECLNNKEFIYHQHGS